MAKYYIEISKYDKRANEYTGNKIIKSINGKMFENLFDIDIFTASLDSKEDLFKIIRSEYEDIDDSYNSARIVSRNYYTIIYNEKDIVDFASNCTLNDIIKYDGTHTKSYVVNRNVESFKKIKALVLEMLDTKDLSNIEKISTYSSRESVLVFLINRYMYSSYDNEFAKEEDFNKIMNELERYKTIRSIYVSRQKQLHFTKNKKIAEKKDDYIKLKKQIVNAKKQINTIEAHEDEFEKNFQLKNGMTWEQNAMMFHNLKDDDKEEFLDEDEVKKAYY